VTANELVPVGVQAEQGNAFRATGVRMTVFGRVAAHPEG
jgi:hypothetical protein